MKLLIFVVFVVLIVGLDATPCSLQKKKAMLKNACGSYRERRGISGTNHRGFLHVHIHNGDEQVVESDVSGGILIRHKRGDYRYCCPVISRDNCTELFKC